MEDFSYGIIPLRQSKEGEWEVFLVQHRHGQHWSFPKGHAEEGENPKEAACRELFEETALSVSLFLSEDKLVEKYQFYANGVKIYKTVSYYLALVEGNLKLQTKEIIAGKWVLLRESAAQLSHQQAKALSKQALAFLIR